MAIIFGTPGNDVLQGTTDDDQFIGSAGNDTYNGNGGFDTVDYSDLNQVVSLLAAGRINKGALGTDTINGISSIIGAIGQPNKIDASGNANGVTITTDLSKDSLTINNVPGLGNISFVVDNFQNVTGTSGNDVIAGNSGDNIFFGSRGNDTYIGNGGVDTVDYSGLGRAVTLQTGGRISKNGFGVDTINGISSIIGATGQRNKINGSGNAAGVSFTVDLSQNSLAINGIPGAGTLSFNVQNFTDVTGTSGDDLIIGNSGNNTFFGSRGNDTYIGNGGSDTVDYTALSQAVTLLAAGAISKGTLGTDTIDGISTIIGARGRSNAIDGSGNADGVSLNANLSINSLTINNIPGLGNIAFNVQNFTNVTGTSGDDLIVGNNRNNVLNGGAGNDILVGVDPLAANPGRGEIDTLTGGPGSDLFVLGASGVVYYNDGNPNTSGTNDYALITDFEAEDLIQVAGSLSSYVQANITVGSTSGLGLFLAAGQITPELIAIIQFAPSALSSGLSAASDGTPDVLSRLVVG